MTTTHYIVANAKTGQAMGRTSLAAPMGWVDSTFAATYIDAESALAAAKQTFGVRETLIGDVRIVSL